MIRAEATVELEVGVELGNGTKSKEIELERWS